MSKKLSRVLYSGASLLMLAPVFGAAVQPITASAKRRPVHYSRRVRRPRYRARRTRRGRKATRRYARRAGRKARKHARLGAFRGRRHAKRNTKRAKKAQAKVLFKRMHKNMRHARRANQLEAEIKALETPANKLTFTQQDALNSMNNPRKARRHHAKRAVRRTARRTTKHMSSNRRDALIDRAFQANGTLGNDNKGLHKAVFHYYHTHHVTFTTAINHVLTQQNIHFLKQQTNMFNNQLNVINKDLNSGHYAKATAEGKKAGISAHSMKKAKGLIVHHHMNSRKALHRVAKPARVRRHKAVRRVLHRKTVHLTKAEKRLSTKDQRQLGKLMAAGVFNHHSKRTDRKILNSYLNDPQLMYVKPVKHARKHAKRVYTLKATNTTNGKKYSMVGTNKQQLKNAYNTDKDAGVASNGQVTPAGQKQAKPMITDDTQEANLAPHVFFWDTTPSEAAQESTIGYNRDMANHEVDMLNNDQNLSNTDKEVLLSDEQMLGQELAQDGVQVNSVNPSVLKSLSSAQD